jgi:hypothetical protein
MCLQLFGHAGLFFRKNSLPAGEVCRSCCHACYAALAKELNGVWLTFDSKAHKHIQKCEFSHLVSKRLPENWDG